MFSNTGRVLTGYFNLNSFSFINYFSTIPAISKFVPNGIGGIRLFKIFNIVNNVNLRPVLYSNGLSKLNYTSAILGYVINASQLKSLIKAIIDTPDFENSKRILY